MWKHLTPSLWMNVANFIFQLLYIYNLPTLFVLIPLRSPCTPFADCAHLSTNYENTFGDYIDVSTNSTHNSDDCVNTPINLTNMPNISSLDLYIPNPTIL
jgi:hypothetical protein